MKEKDYIKIIKKYKNYIKIADNRDVDADVIGLGSGDHVCKLNDE